MATLYLVTGFLGAGKTTFLKALSGCFEHRRLALVVNDFGRERVDATLLAESSITLREVNNGSIFCACRAEQFQDALVSVLQEEPDVVLVEASGLADPTSIRTVLAEPSLAGLEYAGALCLVDAARFHKVRDTALVCRQQLAMADGIVINKTDLATPEQLDAVRADAAALCPGAPVLETQFGAVTAQWLDSVVPRAGANSGKLHARDLTLQKLTLAVGQGLNQAKLRNLLTAFAGDTYRIKGFVDTDDGVVLVDCVGADIDISNWGGEVADQNQLTVLFANGLPARAAIRHVLPNYPMCYIL